MVHAQEIRGLEVGVPLYWVMAQRDEFMGKDPKKQQTTEWRFLQSLTV